MDWQNIFSLFDYQWIYGSTLVSVITLTIKFIRKMIKIYFFSNIKPEFGNLFRELCEEQVLLYIQADEVKNRKKQRKVETEVADLRLKLATVQSKNIVLSNREIRLLRYVTSSCQIQNDIWQRVNVSCKHNTTHQLLTLPY